ncbi:hypothetical protein [Microvirga lotononidis]|uniref:Secreted protein n=1 Tax=Microvirga lotononidis TaxID=864069 RepID=I4YZX6_9HYPH|nr:hypothetical protein [Microvirga lotononidis]EIM29518.1 hypothetical protein MicloDRAFT_00019990 [Microvirga lotononidis]WQO27171.1 hypothetical protein U0023_21360 [Microvirga lotononidis]
MKKLAIFAGAGFMVLSGMGAALAQSSPAISGTPGSLFPEAAPHEIRYFNGVPCRTVLDPSNRSSRIPIACAGQVSSVVAPVGGDVVSTGSIAPAPVGPMMVAPVPMGSPDPYAAPHEIRTVNGVPCRTVLDPNTRDTRIPVACGY